MVRTLQQNMIETNVFGITTVCGIQISGPVCITCNLHISQIFPWWLRNDVCILATDGRVSPYD